MISTWCFWCAITEAQRTQRWKIVSRWFDWAQSKSQSWDSGEVDAVPPPQDVCMIEMYWCPHWKSVIPRQKTAPSRVTLGMLSAIVLPYHLSYPGFTDVLKYHPTVCIIPKLAFAFVWGMELPTVLSVWPVDPVIRLTLIPEAGHTHKKRAATVILTIWSPRSLDKFEIWWHSILHQVLCLFTT